MKRNIFKLTFPIFIVGVMAFLTTSCQQKHPKGIEHVLIIGIEGLTPQGLWEANTPCMDSLMQNGAYSYNVRSVLPSSAIPNWGAMLFGAGPEITGVLVNEWNRDVDKCPPVVMSKNHVFPNVYSVIRQQMPKAELGAITDDEALYRVLENEVTNRCEVYHPQHRTIEKLAEYIKEKKPTLLFTHLNDVDSILHDVGCLTPKYIQAIERTDRDVRTLVNALKEAGINEHTLVMITVDHGGLRRSHSGSTYEEITTPIIYSGRGVKKNYQIKQPVYKYDVAADVIFALGLKAPYEWTGRPVKAAFEGFNEPKLFQGVELLPTPILSTIENGFYGDIAVDKGVQVTIKKPVGARGDIHYTTDGTTPTLESPVYTGTLTLEKSATVKARMFADKGESMTTMGQYRVARSAEGGGLNYSFYYLPGTKTMPALQDKAPVYKGIAYEFSMKEASFPDLHAQRAQYPVDYGINEEGWIKIDADAKYTFLAWSVGGYRLYVNSLKILENNKLTGGGHSEGAIELKKGVYPIRMEYFSTGHVRSYFDLYYEVNGMPRELVSAGKVFRDKAAAEASLKNTAKPF